MIGLGVAAALLLGKIFYIQIIDDKFKKDASNNSMVYDYIYPARGVIYDRNGEILVGNKICYDILYLFTVLKGMYRTVTVYLQFIKQFLEIIR